MSEPKGAAAAGAAAPTIVPILFRLLRWLGHQHWIRRGRDRVLRLLCSPGRAPALAFAVPFFGAV